MTRLRVLWITQSYPSPADMFSGSFHRTQAEALASLGIGIDVVAAAPWVPPFFQLLSPKWRAYKDAPTHNEEGAGVRVHRPRYLAIPRGNVWWHPHVSIASAIRHLSLPKPDLIHAHFAYPPGLIAVDIGAEWHVPVVLTLHGSDVNVYPTFSNLCHRRFTRAVREASAVTAVSQALANRTRDVTGREPRVMPVGVNLRAYENLPSKAEARKLLGLPSDQFLILYVGALTEAKGVIDLLSAMTLLHNDGVSAVMVGDGPLMDEVRNHSACLAMGFQPHSRIPLFMAAADVLILPSYREGLPTVLVEAGAAGLPVIASSVGGIPELLGKDRGYLVSPGNIDHLVSCVQCLVKDLGPGHQRAQVLRAYVNRNYSVEKNASRLLDLYRSLL